MRKIRVTRTFSQLHGIHIQILKRRSIKDALKNSSVTTNSLQKTEIARSLCTTSN